MLVSLIDHPQRLWWLLTLPLILWLARPPRPQRLVLTSHLQQWLQAQKRLHRQPKRSQRLRLLLLLLAFVATIFAHAGLSLGGVSGPTHLVVLVDRSASMGAGATWSQLQQALAKGLQEVPQSVQVRLGYCGQDLLVHRAARHDPGILPEGRGALDLESLAASLSDQDTAVWTLTDGLGPSLAPRSGALTLLGEPRNNLALVSAQCHDSWPLPDVTLDLQVANFSNQAVTASLMVEGAVQDRPSQDLDLAAGAVLDLRLELQRQQGGLLQISLQSADADALPLDNSLSWQLPPPPAPGIAVLADQEGSPAIYAAAQALAMETEGQVLQLDQFTGPGADQSVGYLLVEGMALATPSKGMRLLSFGCRFAAGEPATDLLQAQPAVLDWDRSHPLTRGLDFSELRIQQALARDFAPAAGTPLLWGAQGPLLLACAGSDGTTVHSAFQLAHSNLALLPAFPQLLRRCYAHAQSHRAQAQAQALPGQLLDAAESDLRGAEAREEPRPLPAFAQEAWSLTLPLLALALLAALIRAYL